MSVPWNNWYHCNGNTYGTWLHGDPRGFRERSHKRHVEGDYRNPPPAGKYELLQEYSKKLMKDPPVYLDARQCRIALDAMVTKLLRDQVELLAPAVDDRHFHLLARSPDHQPRRWIGRAKMHASMVLRDYGLKGRVWARKCRALPVADRKRQVNVHEYIVGHRGRGAWVWSFREGLPTPR